MAQHDYSTLISRYPGIIKKMKSPFTSHVFIRKLAETHQQDYIKALAAYPKSKGPFQAVHQRLSTMLNDHPQLVKRHMKEVPSTDIFGKSETCASWIKV